MSKGIGTPIGFGIGSKAFSFNSGIGLGIGGNGAGTTPFVIPVDTDGLIAFYDSDAPNGHTYVTVGPNLVVTQFTNLVADEHHLSVSGNIYTGADTENGLNAFTLAGGKFVGPSSLYSLTDGANTILAVVRKSVGTASPAVYHWGDGTLDPLVWRYDFSGTTARAQHGSGQSNQGIAESTALNVVGHRRTGSTVRGLYNQTLATAQTASNRTSTSMNLFGGSDSSGFASVAGTGCSMAIWNRDLGDTDILTNAQILIDRWVP